MTTTENTTAPSSTGARIELNPVPVCESKHADCLANTVHHRDCGRASIQEKAEDPAKAAVNFHARQATVHADAARALAQTVLGQDWSIEVKDAALRLAFNHRGIASNAALRLCWAAEKDPSWAREARRVCAAVSRAEHRMKKAEWEMAALKTQG